MERCKACDSPLETVDYQARAADEAHRTIIVCPNCPLDANKFLRRQSITSGSKDVFSPMFSRPPPPRPPRNRCNEISTMAMYEYRFEHIPIQNDSYENTKVEYKVSLGRSNGSVTASHIPLWCRDNEVISFGETTEVAMGVKRVSVTSHSIYGNPRLSAPCTVAHVKELALRAGWKTYLTKDEGLHGPPYLSVLVRSETKDEEVILEVYSMFGCPIHMSKFMGAYEPAHLMNLSPRAWDMPPHAALGMLCTQKLDGERALIMVKGSIAFHVSRSASLTVKSFMVVPPEFRTDKIEVYDTEYVPSMGYAIIDVLMIHGKFAPEKRDMGWVIESIRSRVDLCKAIGIFVRQYEVVTDPARQLRSVGKCSDGLIAIDHGSTNCRKLKTVRSVELKVSEDSSCLLSRDNTVVFPGLSPPRNFPSGTILEVRFAPSRNPGRVEVLTIFERVDKERPNDNGAIISILRSMGDERENPNNERRAALAWCRQLSRHINKVVESKEGRPIIMDVGTGDGQSLDFMDLDSSKFSRILVEPDERRVRSLCARLKCPVPAPGVGHLRVAIKSLVTRTKSVIVCNATLGEIVRCKDLMEPLAPHLRCIVGTFSLHHAISDVAMMKLLWKVPVYGCTYVYDHVDSGGVLIDTCGVSMKKVDDNVAEVRWGSDKLYREYPATTSDFRQFSEVVDPSLPPLSFPIPEGEAGKICSHVRLLYPTH